VSWTRPTWNMVGTEAAVVVTSAPDIKLARDVTTTQKLKEGIKSLLYASKHFTSRAINLRPQVPPVVGSPSQAPS
jgi:hypothetical protein